MESIAKSQCEDDTSTKQLQHVTISLIPNLAHPGPVPAFISCIQMRFACISEGSSVGANNLDGVE